MAFGLFSNSRSIIKKLPLLILFGLLLSGCAGLIRTEQPSVVDWARLSTSNSVGQTFVAKYDGLAGIYFYLSPQAAGNGQIQLHLRSEPQSENDLAVSVNTLSIDTIKSPGFYGFLIPSQATSNQKYYYALLEFSGSGQIQVGKAAGDTYINGAFYQNGTPEDAQSAFQLSYARRKVLLGLGQEALTWAGILSIGLFLFILPGWGLFSLFWPGWGKLIWPEKLGLSAALSLAIYPILFLWTYVIGLHLGAIYAWLPGLAGLGMILWRNRKRFKVSSLKLTGFGLFKPANRTLWPDLVFLVIIVILIFSRFWATRSLDLPMGTDSYQHTMIAQLLVDHGGLFTSWQPYTDLTTFTYHFGFHTAVAVFDWLTHLDMYKAVLWVGQLMNIMAVIALYPLATKVGQSRWSGVVAVVVAGLLSPMPMYYVNWGRYTQLAGQVILPVVAWLMWNTMIPEPAESIPRGPKARKEALGGLALVCVALGGLALTHYRVLILALLFMAIVWILYARRGTIRLMLLKTVGIGVAAGALFLPWFIRVFGGKIMRIFGAVMATPASRASGTDINYSGATNIAFYLPYLLWLALFVVFGIGAWRRDKGIILISLWWFTIFLAGNPSWLGLPGSGALSSGTILIATYIPAAILMGAAAGWLQDSKIIVFGSQPRIRTVLSLGAGILLIGFGIWGVRQRQFDVKTISSIATRPDVNASAWVLRNTPANARFLINSIALFHNSIIMGSDGGYWLPLLAGRQTTNSPLNYGFEKDPWPGYLN